VRVGGVAVYLFTQTHTHTHTRTRRCTHYAQYLCVEINQAIDACVCGCQPFSDFSHFTCWFLLHHISRFTCSGREKFCLYSVLMKSCWLLLLGLCCAFLWGNPRKVGTQTHTQLNTHRFGSFKQLGFFFFLNGEVVVVVVFGSFIRSSPSFIPFHSHSFI